MALTEKSVIGSIDVREDGQIQVRRDNVVLRDRVEIARTYHRRVVVPGADLTAEDPRVIAIAKVVHTAAVIAAYEATIAANSLPDSELKG